MTKSLKALFFLITRTSYVTRLSSSHMKVTVEGDRFEIAKQRMRKLIERSVEQNTS